MNDRICSIQFALRQWQDEIGLVQNAYQLPVGEYWQGGNALILHKANDIQYRLTNIGRKDLRRYIAVG
jgi:hypothetical protein